MVQQEIAIQDLPPSFQRLVPALDQVARACALAVLLIGLVVLAGWALKIEALTSVLPGLTSMKPNTALCFVLAGIALAQRQRSGLRLCCAAAIIVFGGLSLAQDFTGADFGTDQLLFLDVPGAAQTVHPGRMSPITAVSFILLGGALALLGGRRAALRRTLEALALIVLSLALIALIGYAYDTKAVFPLPGFGSMALLTALALALAPLALGILCARADGLAGVFASAGLGGQVARHFLPLALTAPVLLGGLVHKGEGAGLFDVTQGTAVFAAAMVLVLVALSWRNARALEASGAERKQAERRLRQNHDTFFNLIQNAPFGLYVVDAQFRLRQVSTASQKVFSNIHPLIGRDFEEVLRLVWSDPFVSEALGHFRHTLQTGEPYAAPNTTAQRQNIPDIESYDWKIERILLPDGQFGVVCYFYDITERMQAGEALRQRTAQFETLLNEAPLGVYLIDADLRVRHVNPTALPVFGNIPDLIGSDFAAVMRILLPKANADETIQRFRHTLETGEACFVPEMIAKRADRQTTEYYEWQINRIPLPDGRHGVVCYFRDVSERVLAQQKISESEERYRHLFNSIDEGFCVIDMIFDEHEKPVDFRFLEVNPAFEKQSGIRDATGRRMREIAPDIEAHWSEICGKVALTGEPVRYVNEAKALNDRWFDIYAFRIGGPQSRKVAVIFNNITERKNAEEALRQSEQRFRALFDKGPIAIYSCDTAGNILEINRRAMDLWGEPKPGQTDEQFRGALKFFLPDGTPLSHSQTGMSRVLTGEIARANNEDVVIERPDGSRITVTSHIDPLKNLHREVTGAIRCFYDITERSRLERETREQAQALVDLDHRKDEFLAMLCHELRNPLAPIANAVHLLRRHQSDDPLQQQATTIIDRQVRQLTHLVDELLDISRINTGQIQLRHEPMAMSDIIERAVETTHPLIVQRRHALTVSLPPQPLWLNADPIRLEQVVVNLLTNAAKYTDEGGRIGLSVQQEGDEVVLRVHDTGIGIASELLPHIFDLFTQAQRSLDRSQGGLGIGLSLVRRLVELHGGTVEAHSVPGHGSEFVVRLPALRDFTPPLPLPSPETAPLSANGCRVLVVDDNVDLARSLTLLLELSGHEAKMVHDGPSALEAALQARPDAVLLDIGLPGLDGFEVARRMRQQPALEGVVLVALTGYGQASDRQRSQAAGFDHHLVKPADFDEVQKILATVSHPGAGEQGNRDGA